ncbi:class I adenylate-forming enzyme family protein [uncultured Sphingomonas sp.]|uniref:class I adenylate-forming enzyme family protein n=1 Tax=uncultured Sphingomonas sp. TaxID=158754 RepID=UPI0035CB843D
MRTALDDAMDGMLGRLTGPGGQLQLGRIERFGRALPTIEGVPATLPAYFAHHVAQHADATFLVSGDERLTFAQVHAAAQQVAAALVARGVAKGDRVGIAMRNSSSWVVLYMGIVMAGGVATLLNGWWQSAELRHAIADVGCRLVFADPPRALRLDGASMELMVVDDRLPLAQALSVLGSAIAALPDIGADDLATILFTSGSTGVSKGAFSDHRAVIQGVYCFLSSALVMLGLATEAGMAPTGQPATMVNLPLFHVTGMVPMLLQSFALGRKMVLMAKWDAQEAMRLIQAERVTYFIGVPLMSYEMLTHPNRGSYDLSSVTDFAAGGAPRPAEHVRRIQEEMGGGAPLIGYGLTETNSTGVLNLRGNYLAKPHSAGRPSKPLVEIGILDDAGTEVAQGTTGEIAIRGICNARGYWGNEAATAAAFTSDGWFRSGDLGYLDEDGYLFIVDRKKDIIIRGGENISCQEVEDALYENPAVAECAVFGLPDERFGEVPGAVVCPADGAILTPAGLIAFLDTNIAGFKIPRRIWIVRDPLPRLGTEKIDKVSLRATYRTVAAAEDAARAA